MELREIDAVGGGRISGYEKYQEVLENLDRQIPQPLLFLLRLRGIAMGNGPRQGAAAHGDVNTVVCQAYIRQARQYDQVVGNDSCLPQLGHGIQLAATQNLMAKVHVICLRLAVVPSRQ